MKLLEQSISPAQQKINEYAERIRNGADPVQVMQGLGSNFRDGIEKRLLELEKQEKPESLKSQQEEQKTTEPIQTSEQAQQELLLRERQKQERLGQEQLQIEELRKQLGVVEAKEKILNIDSLINNASRVSFVDKQDAPFKNFNQNNTDAWEFVSDEKVRNYLDTKLFFDTKNIDIDDMKEVSFIQKDIQIPLDLVVSAAGFTSWKGRGDSVENQKTFSSKYSKYDRQNNTMSSLNVIKHYAGLSSDIPPVGTMRMFIQPDGKVFFDNNGGDSHRISAALLRGQSTIDTKNLLVYSLEKNYL